MKWVHLIYPNEKEETTKFCTLQAYIIRKHNYHKVSKTHAHTTPYDIIAFTLESQS